MIGAQIICHLFGDYVIQSDWMALEKTKRHVPAVAHALTYGLPFLLLRPSLAAWAVIVGTHFIIDRWRLARYVCWAKNQLAPQRHRYALPDAGFSGYPAQRDEDTPYITFWLLIAADNAMHIAINAAALAVL
jgi:hypothetical protein